MENYCIIAVIVLGARYVKSNNLTSFNKPENLTTFEWTPWIPCAKFEDCQWQRNNTCLRTSSPHITCKNDYWVERQKGCSQHCASGNWHSMTTSECQGTTCRNRIRTRTQECVGIREQQGCTRTFTEFCNQEEECDGAWGQWQSQTVCVQSGNFHFQFQRRFCMKQTVFSSNCAATKQNYLQSRVSFCDPNSINPATRKTIPDPNKENDLPRRLSTTSPSTTSTPANINPNNSGVIKTYVFIIQSIVVMILLMIILYLVCYIRKKKKRKKLSFEVATNAGGPEATYNHLSAPNNHGSDSEYEQMLPRAQMILNSRSTPQRPLPDTPTFLLPKTPKRKPRRSSELHVSLPSTHTSPKALLEAPTSSQTTNPSLPRTRSSPQVLLSPSLTPYAATHSAPVSPTRTPSMQIPGGRVRYSSLHKRDNYLQPFN